MKYIDDLIQQLKTFLAKQPKPNSDGYSSTATYRKEMDTIEKAIKNYEKENSAKNANNLIDILNGIVSIEGAHGNKETFIKNIKTIFRPALLLKSSISSNEELQEALENQENQFQLSFAETEKKSQEILSKKEEQLQSALSETESLKKELEKLKIENSNYQGQIEVYEKQQQKSSLNQTSTASNSSNGGSQKSTVRPSLTSSSRFSTAPSSKPLTPLEELRNQLCAFRGETLGTKLRAEFIGSLVEFCNAKQISTEEKSFCGYIVFELIIGEKSICDVITNDIIKQHTKTRDLQIFLSKNLFEKLKDDKDMSKEPFTKDQLKALNVICNFYETRKEKADYFPNEFVNGRLAEKDDLFRRQLKLIYNNAVKSTKTDNPSAFRLTMVSTNKS